MITGKTIALTIQSFVSKVVSLLFNMLSRFVIPLFLCIDHWGRLCQHPLDHKKGKRVPEKHLHLLYWLCQSLGLCGSQKTVENTSRYGTTKPPYLPSEKSVCRSRSDRTRHRAMDWFQIEKGVCQGCILSPCLCNLYAEYIMRNAGLDEAQAGIMIPGRNINMHPYGRKQRRTKEPLAESERGEWKSLLKTQY